MVEFDLKPDKSVRYDMHTFLSSQKGMIEKTLIDELRKRKGIFRLRPCVFQFNNQFFNDFANDDSCGTEKSTTEFRYSTTKSPQ